MVPAIPGQRPRQTYLLVVLPYPFENADSGGILTGYLVDPEGNLPRLAFTLATGSAFVLLLTLAVGYWLAGRIIRPVRAITHAARQISETDLQRRLNLHMPDELGELADTFDGMLARLEAAFARQRQFTADASHELRTPLSIINLESARILDRPHDLQAYTQAVQKIKVESEIMSRLVNDMLALARMDTGKTPAHQQNLDLSELVLDVIEELRPLAQDKGITLWTDDLPELSVHGNPYDLRHMLNNLVDNAIKYAPAAEGQVCIELIAHTDAGFGWAQLKVIDNGPGIPAEHLSHLFDRFYRVDKARSFAGRQQSRPAGSGLGLSIALKIAQAHGGQIDIQSEVGRGSVFVVRLPLAED